MEPLCSCVIIHRTCTWLTRPSVLCVVILVPHCGTTMFPRHHTYRVDKAQHPLCCDSGSTLWNHFGALSSPMHRLSVPCVVILVPHCGTTMFPCHHACTGLIRTSLCTGGNKAQHTWCCDFGSTLLNHNVPLSSTMHWVDKAQHPLCCDSGSLLSIVEPLRSLVITHAH